MTIFRFNVRKLLTLVAFIAAISGMNSAFATPQLFNAFGGCSNTDPTTCQGSGCHSSSKLASLCPAPEPTPVLLPCDDNDRDGAYAGAGCDASIVQDCDDNDPNRYPGATEICDDGIDNNCNNRVDTRDSASCSVSALCSDTDNDGYYAEGSVYGFDCGPVDCDDRDANVHPGAAEICDNLDNNCDGNVDMDAANNSVCQQPVTTTTQQTTTTTQQTVDPTQSLLDRIADLEAQLTQCQNAAMVTPTTATTTTTTTGTYGESDDDAEETSSYTSTSSTGGHAYGRNRRSRDD